MVTVVKNPDDLKDSLSSWHWPSDSHDVWKPKAGSEVEVESASIPKTKYCHQSQIEWE